MEANVREVVLDRIEFYVNQIFATAHTYRSLKSCVATDQPTLSMQKALNAYMRASNAVPLAEESVRALKPLVSKTEEERIRDILVFLGRLYRNLLYMDGFYDSIHDAEYGNRKVLLWRVIERFLSGKDTEMMGARDFPSIKGWLEENDKRKASE